MDHARAALAMVRSSNVFELDNPDPFAGAALQEIMCRVLKNLAAWHPRNAARVVELALRGGLEAADRALRDLIAELTEHKQPLNSALVTYNNILADRGGVIDHRRPHSRPRESPLVAFVIVVLIIDLMNEFRSHGLHLDRSPSARHHSAFSVVSAVLIEAGIGRGGEGAIRKIWKQYGPPVLAPMGGQERQLALALLKKG